LIDNSDFVPIAHEQSASGRISNSAITTSMDVAFSCDPRESLDGLSKQSTTYCLQL
jgi:hypothetical protein